jgi:hypothetical protein
MGFKLNVIEAKYLHLRRLDTSYPSNDAVKHRDDNKYLEMKFNEDESIVQKFRRESTGRYSLRR